MDALNRIEKESGMAPNHIDIDDFRILVDVGPDRERQFWEAHHRGEVFLSSIGHGTPSPVLDSGLEAELDRALQAGGNCGTRRTFAQMTPTRILNVATVCGGEQQRVLYNSLGGDLWQPYQSVADPAFVDAALRDTELALGKSEFFRLAVHVMGDGSQPDSDRIEARSVAMQVEGATVYPTFAREVGDGYDRHSVGRSIGWGSTPPEGVADLVPFNLSDVDRKVLAKSLAVVEKELAGNLNDAADWAFIAVERRKGEELALHLSWDPPGSTERRVAKFPVK